MTDRRQQEKSPEDRRPAHRVRLPGFVDDIGLDDDIGLGDVAKHVTQSLGLHPCGGCERRARRMNRWLTFARSRGGGTA